MKEYLNVNAEFYHLTERKRFVLLPAIRRHIKTTKLGRLLDLACGNALFYPLITKKGYSYYGLDISPILLKQAQKNFPQGHYIQGNAVSFSKYYHFKFDVILCNLLLPALSNKNDLIQVLKECKKVLKSSGKMVFTIVHPSFDMYMQAGLFDRKIKTKFKGYFESGAKFTFAKDFPKGKFVFTDYHWTLRDYFEAIKKAGLKIEELDECAPENSLKRNNPKLYKKYQKNPGYMVLVLTVTP
jgi:SAM-dependent methyltransferase